jgi:uncharacterized protein (DUF924 family)
MRHRGTCHCGRVRFEIESALERFFRCNCSYCARRGSVFTYVPAADFRLLEGEAYLSRYAFSPFSTQHGFCKHCGVFTFSESTWGGGHRISVNAACLEGIDATSLETEPIDGRSFTLPEEVLAFWFGDLDDRGLPAPERSQRWFRSAPEFDAEIRERFGEAIEAALAGHMESWANRPRGRLALILLLDQFTRNVYRGTAQAFAGDERARAHTLAALDAGEEAELRPIERYFVYMPLEHAEDMDLQERSVALFTALAAEVPAPARRIFTDAITWAERHRGEIAAFGRFPGRNQALDRPSTPAEQQHLKRRG